MLVPAGAAAQDSDLFRMLVERVQDDAIFLLTPTGHVASWNTGAARLKGYTADEIIGHSFERFYTPEDGPRCCWPARKPTTASKTKAGGCGRTVRGSGPTW